MPANTVVAACQRSIVVPVAMIEASRMNTPMSSGANRQRTAVSTRESADRNDRQKRTTF